jgi:opacity protein-like surface antigen
MKKLIMLSALGMAMISIATMASPRYYVDLKAGDATISKFNSYTGVLGGQIMTATFNSAENFAAGFGVGFNLPLLNKVSSGLELSYMDWGTINGSVSENDMIIDNSINIHTTSQNLLATVNYDITSKFKTIFKVGVSKINSKTSDGLISMKDFDKDSAFKPMFVIGLGYGVTDSIMVSAEYDQILGSSNVEDGAPSINAALISASYCFT